MLTNIFNNQYKIDHLNILDDKNIVMVIKGNRCIFFNLEMKEIYGTKEIQDKTITDLNFSFDKNYVIVKDGFYALNLFKNNLDYFFKETLNCRYKRVFCFSPVKNIVALLTENEYIHILDCKNKNIINSKNIYGLFSNIDFSPDGNKIVFSCVGKTIIWDIFLNEINFFSVTESQNYFSRCGKYFFSYTKKGISKIDIATKENKKIYNDVIINKIHLFQNNILACLSIGKILFWDLNLNIHIYTLYLPNYHNQVNFSDKFIILYEKNVEKINIEFLDYLKSRQITSFCKNFKDKDSSAFNFLNSNMFDRNLLPLIFENLPEISCPKKII